MRSAEQASLCSDERWPAMYLRHVHPTRHVASMIGHRQLRVRSQAYRAAGTLCLYGNSLCQAANASSLQKSMPSRITLASKCKLGATGFATS